MKNAIVAVAILAILGLSLYYGGFLDDYLSIATSNSAGFINPGCNGGTATFSECQNCPVCGKEITGSVSPRIALYNNPTISYGSDPAREDFILTDCQWFLKDAQISVDYITTSPENPANAIITRTYDESDLSFGCSGGVPFIRVPGKLYEWQDQTKVTSGVITIRRLHTPHPTCGNGVCDNDENNFNCPTDCPNPDPGPEPTPQPSEIIPAWLYVVLFVMLIVFLGLSFLVVKK